MMLSKMTCVWPVGQGSRGVTTMSADVARQRLGARTSGTACGAHAALQRHVALAGHTARITDSRLVNISVGKQSTDMADASVSEWQGGGVGHPPRHQGRGARASPCEQAPQKLCEAAIARWTEGQRDACLAVLSALPSNRWEGVVDREFWPIVMRTARSWLDLHFRCRGVWHVAAVSGARCGRFLRKRFGGLARNIPLGRPQQPRWNTTRGPVSSRCAPAIVEMRGSCRPIDLGARATSRPQLCLSVQSCNQAFRPCDRHWGGIQLVRGVACVGIRPLSL